MCLLVTLMQPIHNFTTTREKSGSAIYHESCDYRSEWPAGRTTTYGTDTVLAVLEEAKDARLVFSG